MASRLEDFAMVLADAKYGFGEKEDRYVVEPAPTVLIILLSASFTASTGYLGKK